MLGCLFAFGINSVFLCPESSTFGGTAALPIKQSEDLVAHSSVLTGRHGLRECIYKAQGCGQVPATSCQSRYPLPLETFTIAEAAQTQGYRTLFLGKWHLGRSHSAYHIV